VPTGPLASRLAVLLRLPIAATVIVSLGLGAANLFPDIPGDGPVVVAAIAVGAAAGGMFLAAVFDPRLQRAVSALNAQRRAEARLKDEPANPARRTPPAADRLLGMLNYPLLAMLLIGANWFHRGPATALLAAAFALTATAQIALAARGQPIDRWFDPFA